ncbi:hypothetical protein [Aeromonas phage phiWae14]|nr:hypothetical protein [Aeromonas phage phiWae14]
MAFDYSLEITKFSRAIDLIGFKLVTTDKDNCHQYDYLSPNDHGHMLELGYEFHPRQQTQNGHYVYLIVKGKDADL